MAKDSVEKLAEPKHLHIDSYETKNAGSGHLDVDIPSKEAAHDASARGFR